MTGRFRDKVIVVTGGNSGMGRETALLFAREGASVVVAARREAEGTDVVNTIWESGGEAIFVRADVSRAEDVSGMVAATVSEYGGLDFAFNNAGVGGQAIPTADYPEDEFDLSIAVNLKGIWLSMKYEIPEILRRGGGAIVNNISVAGLAGGHIPGSAYMASKHGAIGLTKCAASEYAARGIRINAICPGVIDTPMADASFNDPEIYDMVTAKHPIGRVGRPEEAAAAVAFLCSDESSFITGVPLPVDGGMLLVP